MTARQPFWDPERKGGVPGWWARPPRGRWSAGRPHAPARPGRRGRPPGGEIPAVRLPAALLDHGLCARPGTDPDLFFDADRQDEAAAICSGCCVRQVCSDWADETGVEYGVFGGRPRWKRS